MVHRPLNDTNQPINNGFYTFHQATQNKNGQYIKNNGRDRYQLNSYDYLGLNGNSKIGEAVVKAVNQY